MHVSSADDEEKHVANEEEAESPLQVRSWPRTGPGQSEIPLCRLDVELCHSHGWITDFYPQSHRIAEPLCSRCVVSIIRFTAGGLALDIHQHTDGWQPRETNRRIKKQNKGKKLC